jgi:hypothetical protein
MSFEARIEVLTAESELRVAENLYRMARGPEERLEAAYKFIQARTNVEFAIEKFQRNKRYALLSGLSELAQHCASLARGSVLLQVRQSAARFVAKESSLDDGWKWPVVAMRAGWAYGALEGLPGDTAHYFPAEAVGQVVAALNGARFRRRHPGKGDGDGSGAPELIAGWTSDAHMQDSAALATVNLLHSAGDIRSTLLAAQEAGKLDLFGVSILAYFGFKKSQVEGKPAFVATSLQRFVALDMCGEPGAGGRFLPIAAGIA